MILYGQAVNGNRLCFPAEILKLLPLTAWLMSLHFISYYPASWYNCRAQLHFPYLPPDSYMIFLVNWRDQTTALPQFPLCVLRDLPCQPRNTAISLGNHAGCREGMRKPRANRVLALKPRTYRRPPR